MTGRVPSGVGMDELTWDDLRDGDRAYYAPDGTKWSYLPGMMRWVGWAGEHGPTSVVVLDPLPFHRKYTECPRPPGIEKALRGEL